MHIKDIANRSLKVIDVPLIVILGALTAVGLTVMQSATGGFDGKFMGQVRNFGVAFVAMWVVAMFPIRTTLRLSPAIYFAGLTLLVAVELIGETSKGATRWLNLGFIRIQPSEMMKVAVPMMLAWYFHIQRSTLRTTHFLVAGLILFIPLALIAHQPDLGTAVLVLSGGFFVFYLAGLPNKYFVPLAAVTLIGLAGLVFMKDELCQPQADWVILHDYQKNRVCTLLDPTSDPLGKGFHTIQSMVAVGSGGVWGKGYMLGTQAQLDFVPERTTDFIFAVYSEEFGLIGAMLLLTLYLAFIYRGLRIAIQANTKFSKLLAGSLSLTMFVYVFVNIGMVTGILPVVGVPLPMMSYGGTALITTGVACGMLMSIRYAEENYTSFHETVETVL
ncbi:rod shape-determining protein RodA [Pseudomonas aeruginosa]